MTYDLRKALRVLLLLLVVLMTKPKVLRHEKRFSMPIATTKAGDLLVVYFTCNSNCNSTSIDNDWQD